MHSPPCRRQRDDSVPIIGGQKGALTILVGSDWRSVSSQNCGTWNATAVTTLTSFGDGVYLVPGQVAPGIYIARGGGGPICGVWSSILSNRSVVQGPSGDGTYSLFVIQSWFVLVSKGCGTWTRVICSRGRGVVRPGEVDERRTTFYISPRIGLRDGCR